MKGKPPEEYVWRYRIDEETIQNPVYENPVVEMVRAQLENLLQVVVLTKDGKRVQVNGFKFHNSFYSKAADIEYKIFRD